MLKKINITKKLILNAVEGISVEILYALIIMAAAFLVCLLIIR